MADIKVRDLTDTSSVTLDNQIMVLTNDAQNQVQNITVEKLLTNVLSSDNGNVLEQGTDGKLYVETPENITGNLADLDTVNKTSLVNSINEGVSNLSNEATTRANADNNLQSQIDAITAASDVTDIVGTYAQLQAYDTTGLPDNSIIKVLQDESRQNETTYYRWVITGGVGAWVLIGEEGPYYTKSQADSLFATQQTTGNLASLDTSDKTSLVNAINELSSVLDPTQTADYINNSKAVESGAISSNSIILSNVIKYAHSSFDPSKFTVVGNPVITDDGIVSGFSSSNYLQIEDYFANKSTFKVTLIINTPDPSTQTGSGFTGILASKTVRGFELVYQQANQNIEIYISSDGTAWDIYSGGGLWSILPNRTYKINFEKTLTNYYFEAIDVETENTVDTLTINDSRNVTATTGITFIGIARDLISRENYKGSIDLKQFSITVDGVEVFSGNKTGIDTYTINGNTITIPYTKSITGSKIAPASSRQDIATVATALGSANYYTLDEDNGNFTLPMGELYGMIERLNQLAKDEIGLPKATLSNTLNDNEIWLEGAEVSKLTYSKLYAIYGDDYGTPTDSTNFVLPDFRDRVMQGIGSGGTFGYIEAGLPNITGATTRTGLGIEGTAATFSGAFSTSISGNGNSVQGGGDNTDGYFNGQLKFNASKSNSIYGNSTTVQPPAIKVRVKTRFQ